ncbi:sulfatase family protein [Portibacter lacus]|uniref:Heparan N-sulfatase n=1 Tax=Portibacter lacus TaxID=1099794 RepID=A0AA37WGA3_9BACT|nr:sulfatase [Portibacter lacus]GLR19512.1 heparan N-sulfatase [Portibacter lacus]
MKSLHKFLTGGITFIILLSIFGFNELKSTEEQVTKKPNILFCIADDWGWPHAGIYGDEIVKTPTFDQLAREGVVFDHAYVSSPSCTPSRGAILTGQYHWRLEEGANLWSTLDIDIPVYPLLLEDAGYHVGHWRKCWGPGNLKAGGYIDANPGGKNYPKGFDQFLEARKDGEPFSFWLGASDPHRGYDEGSGKRSGMDIDKIKVPGFYPDEEIIRSDIADYYFEVQRFDNDVAKAIQKLEEIGELENTIIVMTGDHGMPFPRCKSNLYDMGVRVPLVIRWGDKVKGDRRVKDFVSLTDLAATFLDAADVEIPQEMTGKSLLPILTSDKEGWIETERQQVIFGKERHVPAQLAPSIVGYPSRGIRTDEFLYIRNFHPERWPVGVPEGASHPSSIFSDSDNGPTKTFLIENAENPEYKPYYEWSFGKRPGEELYLITSDPDQLNNLASIETFAKVKKDLSDKLHTLLVESDDPRAVGGGEKFDEYPYRSSYKLNDGVKK